MRDRFEKWLANEFAPDDGQRDALPLTRLVLQEPTHRTRVRYLRVLLRDPQRWLSRFSNDAVGAALARGCHGMMLDLYQDPEDCGAVAGWPLRRDAVRLLPTFIHGVFAHRLGDAIYRETQHPSELATACYMFWDHWWFDRWALKPDEGTVFTEAIPAMERCLYLNSLACCESAIHGLIHAAQIFPGARRALARFLASNPPVPESLKLYAASDRTP